MKGLVLRTLASFLTASLCGAIITIVLNQTILNAHYLEGRFTAVNGYSRLSSALNNEVVQQAGIADIPQATSTLQAILTPRIVQQRVNAALTQLQAYLHGSGPAPVINLSDLGSRAQAAGVPIGENSDLSQPIKLGPSSNGSSRVTLNLSGISTVTVLTSTLLAVVIGLLSWRWRKYTVLPSVLLSVGVFVGVVALIAYLGPGELGNYVKLSRGSSDAFVSLGRDLVQNIGRDLAQRFGIIAFVCLVIGIVTRIWTGRLQKKNARQQPPSPGVLAL